MTVISSKKAPVLGAVLLAASLSIPSLQFANADAPPERGVVNVKYLNFKDNRSDYRDPNAPASSSHGEDDDGRSGASGGGAIQAYTVRALLPFAEVWSLGTTFTYDAVSGASPTYHTSGLTPMKDSRTAIDAQLTRYLSRGSVVFGASHSGESDYVSNTVSLLGNLSTADKNTTFTLGGSVTSDTIDLINLAIEPYVPANGNLRLVPHKSGATDSKKIYAGLFGITRVLTKNDIVQLNLGYSNGTGYYNDPYKVVDKRPRVRNSTTALARWNHHFNESFTDGISRLSYRYYSDTFGIKAHTFDIEYVQPLSGNWSVMPMVRYYSQNAADFYIPVVAGETIDANTHPVGALLHYTEDPRLAAFGAMTFGLKVTKKIDDDWAADLKVEYYEQRSKWSLSSGTDGALTPYSARSIQVGVSRLL